MLLLLTERRQRSAGGVVAAAATYAPAVNVSVTVRGGRSFVVIAVGLYGHGLGAEHAALQAREGGDPDRKCVVIRNVAVLRNVEVGPQKVVDEGAVFRNGIRNGKIWDSGGMHTAEEDTGLAKSRRTNAWDQGAA